MGSIYIGGQRNKKSGGWMWKIYTFLFLSFVTIGAGLMLTGPTIAEKWLNQKGAAGNGYAFSIRDVELSLSKGQVVLNDVKIFNPKTTIEILKAPKLTIQLNLQDFILSHDKIVSIIADKVDLILSKDFSSEMDRIKIANLEEKKDFYLDAVDGKIGQLNIIEQKEDQSRTVLELKDVNVKVKEVSLQSINKKTQFSITSNLADGGKLDLTGKTNEENGKTPWAIHGSLKQVPSDIFNKIAGAKLPFSFREPKLDVEISAHSDHGKVSGEITPDIKHLDLIEEKPGIPTQSIARVLTEELTFTLPFTLKDQLTLQYADAYRKLKTYRKYPAAITSTETARIPATHSAKPKKKVFSFWPFN